MHEELEFTRFAREDSEDGWDIFHYVALFRSRVLGALSFEYYFRERICCVNYLCIDGQSRLACSNTDHIARSLIARFKSLFGRMSCSRVKNAKYILFDLGPEKSYRAECRHFVKLVGKADKCACKIQYRFLQPNYPRKGLVHEPIER